ncbi:MAG: hypothetical protein ACXV7D_16250 [Thermoanaerobaculia bacterium]
MSNGFTPVLAGSAVPAATAAVASPKNVPHTGGAVNPSAEAMRQQFGVAIHAVDVVWGETTVVVDLTRVHDAIQWLHDDPSQQYDYLSDLTAVEFRDLERQIEVV